MPSSRIASISAPWFRCTEIVRDSPPPREVILQQIQVEVAHFASEPCVLRDSVVAAGHGHTPRVSFLFGSYSREQAVCPTPTVNFDAPACLLLMARHPASHLQVNHEYSAPMLVWITFDARIFSLFFRYASAISSPVRVSLAMRGVTLPVASGKSGYVGCGGLDATGAKRPRGCQSSIQRT